MKAQARIQWNEKNEGYENGIVNLNTSTKLTEGKKGVATRDSVKGGFQIVKRGRKQYIGK